MIKKVKKPKYSSGFEQTVADMLKQEGIPFDYERDVLYYYVKRRYTGDFFIFDDIIIEAKGYFKSADRTKMKLLKEQHPDKDFRLLFMADNKLSKKSNQYYSDWAKKNGFDYAIGEIPRSWKKEIEKRLLNS